MPFPNVGNAAVDDEYDEQKALPLN